MNSVATTFWDRALQSSILLYKKKKYFSFVKQLSSCDSRRGWMTTSHSLPKILNSFESLAPHSCPSAWKDPTQIVFHGRFNIFLPHRRRRMIESLLIKTLKGTLPSRLSGCNFQTEMPLGLSVLPWAQGAGQCATVTRQEGDRWHWRQHQSCTR